ncbi:MAG TPA: DUF6569 family protein [Kofleriaceae bacterium]|jgi:hypothetical protein|nr:DUF6569 family protein [Kofleriaceae bacterium]
MRHAAGSVAILLAATTALAAPPAPPPAGSGAALSDRTALLAPIQVASLTLTPIIATGATDPAGDAMLTLDEAMAAHKVTIREIAGGTVNSLTFVNKAEQPVFLLAGEVIIGGKQDRIIGRNTVIPASTTQEVPVYCVEHGRWTVQTNEFASARALAHGRLRAQASYAEQQDVWNEVAAKNVARRTTSASDTYRRVAQQQSDGTLAGMEKQVTAALSQIRAEDRSRMVGFAVALDGAVATVDMFGSPALFGKLETKLVRSYLTEAVDVRARPNVKPPTASDVKAFMADADKASESRSYDTGAADTTVNRGERAFKAKVGYKRAPVARPANQAAPPAAAATAAEPTVYENYQVK